MLVACCTVGLRVHAADDWHDVCQNSWRHALSILEPVFAGFAFIMRASQSYLVILRVIIVALPDALHLLQPQRLVRHLLHMKQLLLYKNSARVCADDESTRISALLTGNSIAWVYPRGRHLILYPIEHQIP